MNDKRVPGKQKTSRASRHRADRKRLKFPIKAALATFAAALILAAAVIGVVSFGDKSGSDEKAKAQATVLLRREGVSLYNRGLYEESRVKLARYLITVPDDWQIRKLLADILWRDGKPRPAYNELERAVEESEPSAEIYYRLGILARQLGEDSASVDYLRRAVEIGPDTYLFQAELAKAFAGAKDYRSARLIRREAASLLPEEIGLSGLRDSTFGPDGLQGKTEEAILAAPAKIAPEKTVEISGMIMNASGSDKAWIVIAGPEGKFWDSANTTWSPKPISRPVKQVGRTRKQVFWEFDFDPPDETDLRLAVIVMDSSESIGWDNSTAVVEIDDRPPIIARFQVAGGRKFINTRRIAVRSYVRGAEWMRFASDLKTLKSTPYQKYEDVTKFRLEGKTGRKMIYGQWRDTAGNETAPGSHNSYQEIILDRSSPGITSAYPGDGAKNINVDVLITVNFKELQLDGRSVNKNTIRLYDQKGKKLAARVRFDRLTGTAVLAPEDLLDYGRTYRIVLSSKIKDVAGNRLPETRRWQFTTVKGSTHPPGKPMNFKVTAGRFGNRLNWDPPAERDLGDDFNPPTQGGYNIYRSYDESGPRELINHLPVRTSSYTDRELEKPAIVYYSVKAIDAGGLESAPTPVKSNSAIRVSSTIKPGGQRTISAANGVVRMELEEVEDSVRVIVRTAARPDAPVSPIGGALELKASSAVRLEYLRIFLPGDPSGSLILKSTGGGWQPLPEKDISYDLDRGSVAYGPLPLKGTFTVVNHRDTTPPSRTGRIIEKKSKGAPAITWAPAFDGESGISSYRLFVSGSVIELPPDATEFTDYEIKSGQLRDYTVAAVNGAGLIGPLETLAITATVEEGSRHKPALLESKGCRACHLSTARRVARDTFCRVCHDGTGSRLELASGETVPRSCGACHDLGSSKIRKAYSSDKSAACGGCHGDVLIGRANAHETTAGLTGLTCISCHSLHRPDGKNAGFLVDPANTNKTWDGTITDFCLNCHSDADPPVETETPGTVVPRSIYYRVTAARIQASGSMDYGWNEGAHSKNAGCPQCHEPHDSSGSHLVPYRSSDELCLKCHRRGNSKGAADIQSELILFSGHNRSPEIDVSILSDASATPGASAACADCHNPHSAKKKTVQAKSNLITGPLIGVPGIVPLNGAPGSSPWFMPIESAVYEYQICFKCHSSYSGTAGGAGQDLSALFNPANPSYHPVEAPALRPRVRQGTLENGWTPGSTMACSSCHQGQTGAHSSTFKPLLPAAYGPLAEPDSRNDFCFRCHSEKVYTGSKAGSRFAGRGGHRTHVKNNGLGCDECHEVHGSSYTEHLIKIVSFSDSGTVGFSHDSSGGSCISTCHKRPGEPRAYRRAY